MAPAEQLVWPADDLSLKPKVDGNLFDLSSFISHTFLTAPLNICLLHAAKSSLREITVTVL